MNRTEAQERAITTMRKTLCVDAGAGSGKTRVLIERIVHLIESRAADLDAIVAITFTDKAAAEMKERLRQAFHIKAPYDDPVEMTHWREMERRVETGRISTIHSFCASLLREHALRIGKDPEFAVLTEAEASLLKKETVAETVHGLLEADDPAATHTATEYGCAKLIEELDKMLSKRGLLERSGERWPLCDADALSGAWVELARKEYERRLQNLARSREVRVWIEQLESLDGLCIKATDGREIQRLAVLAQLQRMNVSHDVVHLRACVDAIAASSPGHPLSKNWQSPEIYEKAKALLECIKKHMESFVWKEPIPDVESRAAQCSCDLYAVFAKVHSAYTAAKDARSAIDFDDLIASTWRMLHDNESVRGRVARGIRFLLVDEFQDTDWMQLDIARMLAEESGGPDWFFVGDAKQSIYDFRGAEVEVFQKQRAAAEETIPLMCNFRTVPEIIGFVNGMFAETGLLEAVEPAYSPLEAHRPVSNETRVEFLIPREHSEKVSVEIHRRDEADLIAWRIQEMCTGPNRVTVGSESEARPAEYGDVAILLRVFSNIHLYEEGLRRRSIPYNVVAGAGFYERQEILDLRNLLTVVVNPWDEIALLGFLRSPLAGLSDNALAAMREVGGVARVFNASDLPDEILDAELLHRARALIDGFRRRQDLPLPAFMRYVLDTTKHEAILLDEYLGERKAWNIRKAIELAEDFARTQPARLPAFVQYLEDLAGQAVREGDAAVQTRDAVTLMTVHKAKGLEFPIVVLADSGRELDASRMGHLAVHRELGIAAQVMGKKGEWEKPAIYSAIRNARSEKEAAESARLLYVGMTRARDWLLFGGTPKPGKNSWLETLDDAYGLVVRAHGNVIVNDNWSARVWREGTTSFQHSITQDASEPPDVEAITRRAAPLIAPISRRTISVSTILDLMMRTHDDDDSHHEFHGDTLPTAAATRGTLIHRLLERWVPGQPLDIDAFLARECPALNLREILADDFARILHRFEASALARRIASAKCIEREAPFLLRIGGVLASGTIDALLDRDLIVDYKTGRYRKEQHERYEWQLRLYAAAVRALLNKAPTAATLCYVDLGEEHAVDIGASYVDEALERAAKAIASKVSHETDDC